MKILFTGSSSFTGYWFVKSLYEKGHKITTVFTKSSIKEYSSIRKQRVESVLKISEPLWGCKFGDNKFLDIINRSDFDLVCLHGAYVNDYKSFDFNVINAIQENCNEINKVFNLLSQKNQKAIIATGSVFEQREGVGENQAAFSPYGLSKGISNEIYQYYAEKYLIKFGKFVIPNPFGPFEEPRFTTYLIKNWFSGKVPSVNAPTYIRDNIHISLLAETYCRFLEVVSTNSAPFIKMSPSGYIESQGAFALRFAKEISQRTGLDCPIKLENQKIFDEPVFRTNYHPFMGSVESWDETKAWDRLADYYIKTYS